MFNSYVDNKFNYNVNAVSGTLRKTMKDSKFKKQEQNILTEYEIGTYDKNMHEFYNKDYDVHNELMEIEHETL